MAHLGHHAAPATGPTSIRAALTRPSGLVLHLKGFVRPWITPDDPDAVEEIIERPAAARASPD